MRHPLALGMATLDMESKEVKPVVYVGNFGLLRGEFQVQLLRKERMNVCAGLLDLGPGCVGYDHEVIRVPHHQVVAESGFPAL